jgi:hypothetical protein
VVVPVRCELRANAAVMTPLDLIPVFAVICGTHASGPWAGTEAVRMTALVTSL